MRLLRFTDISILEQKWQSELRDGQPPRFKSEIKFDLVKAGIGLPYDKIEIYDPRQDKWIASTPSGYVIGLPDFKRSLVIRIRQ